jgi:hypothetical protein
MAEPVQGTINNLEYLYIQSGGLCRDTIADCNPSGSRQALMLRVSLRAISKEGSKAT